MSAALHFLDVARRCVETMEEETAEIAAGRDPDGRGFADRKAMALFELTRAARGLDPATPALRPALTELRAAVERNHAAIGVRLEAARRVAETMKRVVAEIEWDGAYDAARLLRDARQGDAAMIRSLFLAVWAAAVALGAERGATYVEARREAARIAAEKPQEARVETRKAKPLSVPISRGGQMRGYVVMNIAYVVDVAAAAAFGRDIEPYLLDQAFSALYADAGFDADRLDAYDLARFKTTLGEGLARRLGAPIVRDVLIQEFNYVAAADLRK